MAVTLVPDPDYSGIHGIMQLRVLQCEMSAALHAGDLLLVDADAAERRLVSAIAARAGWSVVGAADEETAVGLLQGPHGREVRAALLGSWNELSGPSLVAALRARRDKLPIIVLADEASVSSAVEAMRSGASDFISRPVAPERLLEALAANADRRNIQDMPSGHLTVQLDNLDGVDISGRLEYDEESVVVDVELGPERPGGWAEKPRGQKTPCCRPRGLAYADAEIPLGHGRTLAPPRIQGRLLEALKPRADETGEPRGLASRALAIPCHSPWL